MLPLPESRSSTMKKAPILFLLLASAIVACSSEKEPATQVEEVAAKVAEETPAAAAVVYDAICGCVLPDVGACGNYVKVADAYVVLEHPSLGVMEFCKDGEAGAKVKVAGEMKDGKLVAASYERID
jgi:hypothetical protein